MSSVGQMVDEEVIGECGDQGRLGERRSGLKLVSETFHDDVQGREGTGHECSFYCRCWTDE
ncbi:hypothetical protein SAMN05518670_0399 [Paenibacillus sp. OK076]|nr:hypothetical protein SAMN05518670_0399 [Paenibacillus sp. OK076]